MKKMIVLGGILVTLLALTAYGFRRNTDGTNVTISSNRKQTPMLAAPAMTIDSNKSYTAVLKTTVGDIKIRLHTTATPKTANNFVYLARNNFYNGTPFHRVLKGFMIQGGDPRGDGTGGPGYFFDDELFEGEYMRGTVAMANAGPNTNGSQFFIMHADYPLQKKYIIFGTVTKGMEVADAIAEREVRENEYGEESQPVEPVIVQTVEIIEQ